MNYTEKEVKIRKLEKAVDRFANTMKLKLRLNSHKPGWQDCGYTHLLERLHQEVGELAEAVTEHISSPRPSPNSYFGDVTSAHVEMECADVANFAMMIAYIASQKRLPEPPK